jgi:DNA-binding CsgD family transcriptional regulator
VTDTGLAGQLDEVIRAGGLLDGDRVPRTPDALPRLVCAAAPVVDPTTSQILGTIGLTCLPGEASALMLLLARRAAREIEQRLVDPAGIADRTVLQRFLRERKRAKGPIVLLSERRMIANAAAGRLLVDGDEPILRDYVRRFLNRGLSDRSTVVLSTGTPVTVRGEPVLDGRSPVATLLRLREIAGEPSDRAGGRRRATVGWASLTDTERSVTDLVAQGLTNKEAGEQLFLSRHTVGSHLRSIFGKLGLNSRVELTRFAIQQGDNDEVLVS